MGVLDSLVAESLNHTIESIHRMVKGVSGLTPIAAHASNVPCAWSDEPQLARSSDGTEVITTAKVRILPSLDVDVDHRIVKNGKHYRVIKVETPDPDFDGTIPYKILRVM
jgi:hypothetical protein